MSPIRKAVILARGLGTRMRREAEARLTDEQARVASVGIKALIPVGRPFLDYVLSGLADAGLDDVCLVVGPEHDAVRTHYTTGVRLTRVSVAFAIQPEPRGTADAVLAARDFVGTSEFLVLNSDNYYPVAAYEALRRLDGPGVAGFSRRGLLEAGHIDAARVASYALLDVAPTGALRRIVEKPDAAAAARVGPDALVGMNCWRFGPAILEACGAIGPSPRGELELPAAVQYAIDQLGTRFAVIPFELPVLDLSTRLDIAAVATALQGVVVRL